MANKDLKINGVKFNNPVVNGELYIKIELKVCIAAQYINPCRSWELR